MAQSTYTPIQLYYSTTGSAVPVAGNLANGELAINIADGILYYKNSSGVVSILAKSSVATGSISFGSTGLTPSTPTSGAVVVAGTLNAASGGTGQSAYTIGDILYASSSTALSRLADIATGNALLSGGVGAAPSWGKIGLTTHVSGVLPIANGGTNASSAGITAFNNITGYSATGAVGSTSSNLVFSVNPTLTQPSFSTIVNTGTLTLPTSTDTLVGRATTDTLTNKSISGSTNTFTNIPNSGLTNSAITINGSSVSLGGSITVTATASSALTIGTGLSGTSYNGSAPVTIAIDSTVATLTGAQTLTNKSMSGSSNTFNNIPNSALTNSSVTVGTTAISLGSSSLTLAGLTSVTVTQDPTSALQLATKQYVDNVAQGLNVKAAVAWGTTANITLSGLSTQAGGEWTGSLNSGDRILVKNQSTSANNGIYTASSGAWTRSTDADTWNELVSAFVFVQQGATLGDTGWVCTVDPGGTLGVTPVTWTQFSGAGTYSAGTGLTLTGTTFSISNTGVSATTYGSASSVPTITVNAQGQITSASNTSIAINGNQITSGVVGTAYGGTALSSFTSGGAMYATSTSVLTTGTLPVTAGGTGQTSFTAGQIQYGAFSTSANLFYDSANIRLGVGTNTPAVTASFVGTDAIRIPSGTTAQQPTGVAGYLRFNTTTTQFEGYNGTAWASVGGATISNDTTTSTNIYPISASTTSGTALTVYTSNAKYLYKPSTGELQASEMVATNGIFVNSNTVSSSYTIDVGNNGFSVGPMTVASGATVTVSSGQSWVII